jgi:aryl-alcohol dehydrogenase-like predicted oxidoreductase
MPELLDAAERAGTTPDALALAAALAQPWADVVLSGAATTDALKSNVAALTLDSHPGLLRELAAVQEEPTQYWRTRGELPWN